MPSQDDDPIAGLRPQPDRGDPRASSLLRESADEAGPGWRLLGLPYDGGVRSRPGARFGPRGLREALSTFGCFDGELSLAPLHDLGDLSLPTTDGAEAHARIESAARRLFGAGGKIVFAGGDHGCTGSIVRGLAAARPGVRIALVSIDAHLDVREYPDERNLSSGTPLRRALECPELTGERTAVIGVRPFANAARYVEWAATRGMRVFTCDDVAKCGAPATAEEALRAVASEADALYLTIDLDTADVAYAPGVSAPAIGGLTSREMISLVASLAAAPQLVGCDLMELSPPFDVDDRTARLAARLLLEVLRTAP